MTQLNRIEAKLNSVLEWVQYLGNLIRYEEGRFMAAIDDLQTQVEEQTTVEQSAITLINGLAEQLAAAGTDPAKLAALTAQLKASADGLAAAVVANTATP